MLLALQTKLKNLKYSIRTSLLGKHFLLGILSSFDWKLGIF